MLSKHRFGASIWLASLLANNNGCREQSVPLQQAPSELLAWIVLFVLAALAFPSHNLFAFLGA